jgi:hypothetical protein
MRFQVQRSKTLIITDDLRLVVPEYQGLWYRKHLMEDPEIMNYNKGYDLGFDRFKISWKRENVDA